MSKDNPNPNFKISQSVKDNYIQTINYYIDNPNPESLIELCLSVSNDKEEIIHQIPHFMFPLVAICPGIIPIFVLPGDNTPGQLGPIRRHSV